jgi:hypothetical protein
MRSLVLIFLFLVSITTYGQETDDLYYNFKDRKSDTIKNYVYFKNPNRLTPNYNSLDWRPFGFNYWGYNRYYPYQYYNSRTIVVVPKENNYNYGKRPNREYNNSSDRETIKRGRN